MINRKTVNRFCAEPLHLIANYDLAINSLEKWDCHHRLEIQDGKVTSREELIDCGLYYGRPASELIFLRHGEHSALHRKYDRKWIEAAHSPEAEAKRIANGTYKKWVEAAHSPEAIAKRIANGSYKKVAQAMNSLESIAKRAKKCQKAVIQLTKEGEFVKEYESMKQAALDTGIAGSSISKCASGKLKFAGGFVWQYN